MPVPRDRVSVLTVHLRPAHATRPREAVRRLQAGQDRLGDGAWSCLRQTGRRGGVLGSVVAAGALNT